MSRTFNVKENQLQAGFTLVELSMSLLFIAFIILFLTTTLLSIIHTYNRGIWINQINAAGRQINSDIADQARYSVSTFVVRIEQQRLCIGGVVYLWNTAAQIDEKKAKNWYYGEGETSTKLRLSRVIDKTGEYCDGAKMPVRNDSGTSALLGQGVIVQQFNPIENPSTGLLRIRAVFSTEGDVQPKIVNNNNQLTTTTDPNGKWRCGEMVGGVFKVGNNQFCSFAEFDIITYRRLGE
jgi:hypothetical protein